MGCVDGKVVVKQRLSRDRVIGFMSNLPCCLVGMEACGSSNHWTRELTKLGHTVKLISPQYVKPYVKTNKNDYNDAEAICEAVTRPHMRFVAIKTIEQQDIQARFIEQRTALVNMTRGILAEYGIIAPQGITQRRLLLQEVMLETTEDKHS